MNILATVPDADIKRGVIVVFVWVDSKGEWHYLFLWELNSKEAYFKEAGMLSLPAETTKRNDRSKACTIDRLCAEELGIAPCTVPVYREIRTFPHGIQLEVGLVVVDEPFEALPTDGDVAYCGWIPESKVERLIDEAAGFVRIETVAAISAAKELFHGGAYV